MFSFSSQSLPYSYDFYKREALLVDEFDLQSREPGRDLCFLAVRHGGRLPLMLTRSHDSAGRVGAPAALLVEETGVLFFGVGPWTMAYDLAKPRKLWEDYLYPLFWGWTRHGDFVLLSAEVEFAAYDLSGHKIWSRTVGPPWTYSIEGALVRLESGNVVYRFPLDGSW